MKVNFLTQTVELTAKELRQSSTPNSYAYSELLRVMRDLPHFQITVKHSRMTSNANRGLTYAYMEQHIACHAPEKMDEFCALRAIGGYPKVTKWFRSTFPEYSTAVDLCSKCHLAA